MSEYTVLRVTTETRQRLRDIGKKGQTYNDIIRELIKEGKDIKNFKESNNKNEKISDSIKVNENTEGILGRLYHEITGKKQKNIKNTIKPRGPKNKTGIYRVSYSPINKKWQYTDSINKICITDNKSLKTLEEKVKNQGIDWIILDEKLAEKSYNIVRRTRNNFSDENKEYTYPRTYLKDITVKLNDDGTVQIGSKIYENYVLLRIFYLTQPNLKIRDYKKLRKVGNMLNIAYVMRIAHRIDKELQNGSGGEICDIIFNIFENDYSVPFFITFTMEDDELLINERKTGIKIEDLKVWINELNDSFDKKYMITRIMHDNPTINQRYLFYTLMNEGNQHIQEIISKEDD